MKQKVTSEGFEILLNEKRSFAVPHALLPREMKNHGNFIISLSDLCQWLAAEAEAEGVEIFPGFAVADIVVDQGRVIGVETIPTGLAKDGKKKPNYEPGVKILGTTIVLAEGAKGSTTKHVVEKFKLDSESCPGSYSIGFKEIWTFPNPSGTNAGNIFHTAGYPLSQSDYGGGFAYWKSETELHVGFVVGLDYKNPFFSPYAAFQTWKNHPRIFEILKSGECVSYGARVIATGGIQSIPDLEFPGGMIVGCAGVGLLNVAKIKGSHTAMKSGMLAAEAIAGSVSKPAISYTARLQQSWVFSELQTVRNCKPAFTIFGGAIGGFAYSWLSLMLRGREPWTFRWGQLDWMKTEIAEKWKKVQLPSVPKSKVSFSLLDSVARTNVYHDADQPSHLKVVKPLVPLEISLPVFAGPESRFCPAGVYEYLPVEGSEGNLQHPPNYRLQINAQNCIHCKSCVIKTPMEFIEWTAPAGGPNYQGM